MESKIKKYDIAAYVWPSYTGDEPRSRIFWPEGYGEWQTVKAAKPWYPDHKWPRRPLWGYVNEADPFVMEMEIEAAAAHGVNVFIYDWYWYDNRPFLEQCLDNGYMKARNNDKVKFYIMWANHTATSLWDKRTSALNTPIWDGAVDRKTFESIVHRTIEKYFSHPSYYKIDGKPVYMLYDAMNFVKGLGGVNEALDAIEFFRNETVKAGFPGLELHISITGPRHRARPVYGDTDMLTFVNMAGFDGATHYNFVHFAPMNRGYIEILEDVKAEWKCVEETVRSQLYPHVSLGWDNTLRFNPGELKEWRCYDNTPENVQKGLELAKEYIDNHPDLRAPLITVNSWNEWTEGSYLHPDDLNGYGYLEAIKKVFLGN